MVECMIVAPVVLALIVIKIITRDTARIRRRILNRTIDEVQDHSNRLEKLSGAMWDLRSEVGQLDRRLAAVDYNLKQMTPPPEVCEDLYSACDLDREDP